MFTTTTAYATTEGMIPRITYSSRAAHRENRVRSAFALGSESRRLRVFVDHESLPDDLPTRMLGGFDGHPLVLYDTTNPGGERVLTVDPVGANGAVSISTTYAGGMATSGVLFPEQKRVLAAKLSRTTTGIDALTDRLLIASHAELHGADAFVTECPELLAAANKGHYSGANIMCRHDALALIGLYLRLRGDFNYLHSGRSTAGYGQGGYYEALATELLSEAVRWRSCCPGRTSPGESAPRGCRGDARRPCSQGP